MTTINEKQKVVCECGKSLKIINTKHLQSKYHLKNIPKKEDIDKATAEKIAVLEESILKAQKELKILKEEKELDDYRKEQEEKEDVDNIILKLAKFCIDNNYYRTDNHDGGYRYLSGKEIYNLTNSSICEGGYIFLDEECKNIPEKSGMIRLYSGESNPKFSFWTTNDVIDFEPA